MICELEFCVSTDCTTQLVDNIRLGQLNGIRRFELCSQLNEHGLTPKMSAIKMAKSAAAPDVELLVIVRPHSRDFCYNNQELMQMRKDIEQAKVLGADGVVLGALNQHDEIDIKAMEMLLDTAYSNQLMVTFHRAFDVVRNSMETIDLLAEMGIHRLLTSGEPWQKTLNVDERYRRLLALSRYINRRFELVIGGGVNLSNLECFTTIANAANTLLSFHSHSCLVNETGDIQESKVRRFIEELGKSHDK